MTAKLILSILVFSAGVFATEVDGAEKLSTEAIQSQQEIQNQQALDNLAMNIQKIYSSGKVTYVKNPCAGKRGYRLNQYRGFAFDRGEVAKFQLNGWFRAEPVKYHSLGEFFHKRRLCSPINKKLPALSNVGIDALEIW
tara:strand:+ start:46214 stop:46630 length:417 start_codon:yes stop_codon:yes gene_type:complete